MSEKRVYVPTDPDAVWVAGHRVPEDRRLALTDEEARYELLAGTIRAAGDRQESGQPRKRDRGDDQPVTAG